MPESKCVHLQQFMEAQMEIVKNHIDEHKWFNHIEDYNAGVADFIKKYAWIMREFYCQYSCPHKDDCECKVVPKKEVRKESCSCQTEKK